MKFVLIGIACLMSMNMWALEYEVQFENEKVHVARIKIMPHEEIALHRDDLPQIVIALQGGIITRLESNGDITNVNFPTGVSVYRDIDPPNELHKSVNKSDKIIELIIVQLKKDAIL